MTTIVVRREKKDYSTAIMDRKKAPHKLQVEDSKQDDNSIVEMTQAKMDELKIFRGDAVIIKGKFSLLIYMIWLKRSLDETLYLIKAYFDPLTHLFVRFCLLLRAYVAKQESFCSQFRFDSVFHCHFEQIWLLKFGFDLL